MALNNEAKIVITAQDKTAPAFDSAKRGLAGLKEQAAGLQGSLAALGGALAGSMTVVAIKGAIDTLDQLDDLAEKTGIAAEQLSVLSYAGEVAGTPLESLAKGIQKLSVNMAAAAGGSKEQQAAFDALGISLKGLDGSLKGSDQILGEIADKFSGFKDSPEKAALAVEVFGKAGADLIPILNKGSEGIAALGEEAKRLGVVISNDLAASAAEFNDDLKRIQLSTGAAYQTIAGQLLPTLNELAKAFLETNNASGSTAQIFGEVLNESLKKTAVFANDLVTVFQVAGLGLYSLGVRIKSLAKLDFEEFDVISRAVERDSNEAWEKAKLFSLRINGALNSIAGAGRGTGADPRILGQVDNIELQTRAWREAAPVIAKAGEAAKQTADEFGKLYAKITGKDAGLDAEFGANLATLKAGLDAGRLSLQDYVRTVETYIQQQPFAVAAAKAASKAAEDRQAAALKEADAIREAVQAQEAAWADSLASVRERQRALQDEEAAARLSAGGNMSLAEAVERVTLARLAEKQAGFVDGSEGWQAIQREIEARRELLGLIASKESRQAAEAAARDAADAWQRTTDQISQSLTDALMTGGKSGAEYIQGLFRSMVLRPVIQFGVNSLLSQVGLMSPAASALSGASGLSSLASSLPGAASWLGLGGATGAGVAANVGLGTSLGLSTAEASAAATAAGQAAASGVLSGLSSVLPWVAGAGLLGSIIKGLDNSGTYHSGAIGSYSAATGTTGSAVMANGWTGADTFGQGAGVQYSAQTQATVNAMAQAVVGILDSTAKTFGEAAGYAAAVGFADDSSKDGAFGSLVIRQLDRVLVNWADQAASTWAPKTFADGEAGAQAFAAAVAQSTRDALDAMDLPGWADQVLAALGDAPTLDGLAGAVQQIQAIGRAFDTLGYQLTGFATLSTDAQTALLAAAGGMDALAGNAATYYQAFYTEAERQAATTAQITDVLASVNIALPATREAFRAVVEQYTALGAEGAPVAATLLSVAGAFASVVPAAMAVGDAVDEAGAAIGRTAEDIAASIRTLRGEGQRLQVDLLTALGDAGGAAALQRQLDTAGFTAAELAIYDYNAALRAQIDTLNTARESAQAVAQERAGLEGTLLGLLGDTAALRGRELAALDPANRALQWHIYALQDAQSALSGLDTELGAVAGNISQLEGTITGLGATMRSAASTLNSISVAQGGPDQTATLLWDQLRAGGGTADERLGVVNQLVGLITSRIASDTAAEQARVDDLARAQADALDLQRQAADGQRDYWQTQLDSAQRLADLGQQLRDYVQGLRVGNLSALTPQQQLGYAQTDYQRTLSAAQAGDASALQRLQGSASTYLEQARTFDPGAYGQVFAAVTGALDRLSGSNLSDAQRLQQTAQAQLSQLSAIAAAVTGSAQAASVANVISQDNADALAELQGIAAGILSQAAIDKAAAEARLTEEAARQTKLEEARTLWQGNLLIAQQQARDALVDLPGALAQNNAALVAEVQTLRSQVEQLQAALVSGLGAVAQTTADASASNAATVAGAVVSAVASAAGAPQVI